MKYFFSLLLSVLTYTASSQSIKIDDDFKSDDADLKMKNPVEVKNELEEGLRVTVSDFNPFKLTRERK